MCGAELPEMPDSGERDKPEEESRDEKKKKDDSKSASKRWMGT